MSKIHWTLEYLRAFLNAARRETSGCVFFVNRRHFTGRVWDASSPFVTAARAPDLHNGSKTGRAKKTPRRGFARAGVRAFKRSYGAVSASVKRGVITMVLFSRGRLRRVGRYGTPSGFAQDAILKTDLYIIRPALHAGCRFPPRTDRCPWIAWSRVHRFADLDDMLVRVIKTDDPLPHACANSGWTYSTSLKPRSLASKESMSSSSKYSSQALFWRTISSLRLRIKPCHVSSVWSATPPVRVTFAPKSAAISSPSTSR